MKKQVFIINNQIKNFIQSYNNQLKNLYKNIKDDDTENTYLVLIYEDLLKKLKDKDKFIEDYIAFAEQWKIPYTCYPYYGSFNKAIIKASDGIPHPSFEVKITSRNDAVINITHQIAPGCLILNVNMLKKINFKFDNNYPTVFYLQDLAEKCYRAKLWCSNCWFLDILHSWEGLAVDNMDIMNPINVKNFQDEQKKYFDTNKDCKFKEAQPFLDDFKKWLAGEEWTVETNIVVNTNVAVQNSNINLSVPNNLTKDEKVIEVKPEETSANNQKAESIENIESIKNISIETFPTNNKALDIVNAAVAEDKKAE